MSTKLNLVVDGSWLFKACKPRGFLALKTENSMIRFKLDFNKLVVFIQDFVSEIAGDKIEYSIKYIASSIFDTEKASDPIKDWPQKYEGITEKMINDFTANKTARTREPLIYSHTWRTMVKWTHGNQCAQRGKRHEAADIQ